MTLVTALSDMRRILFSSHMIADDGAVPLQWDADDFQITNKPEPNKLLTREYRGGREVIRA